MFCPKCAGQQGQLLLGGLPTMGTELWCVQDFRHLSISAVAPCHSTSQPLMP